MQRNSVLDVTKGLCVLAMTAHHAINYFPNAVIGVRYFHFVTGAFPFLAGYVVTHFSARKYDPANRPHAWGFHLLVRGLRLLLLCGLCNLALYLFLGSSAKLSFSDPLRSLVTLYLTGSYNEVSFSLLIPIGYVLVLFGLIGAARLLRRPIVAALAAALVGYCVWQSLAHSLSYYLGFIALGLVGAALGYVPGEKLIPWCDRVWPALLVFLSAELCITFFAQEYPLYAYTVVATVLAMYTLSLRLPPELWISRQLTTWGRYSLVLYLVQVCFLFALRRVFDRVQMGAASLPVAFVVACLMQAPLCWILDDLRRRVGIIDRSYRFFFA